MAGKGIQEVILTGVNTGDFGRGTDMNFLQLLQQLDRQEEIAQVQDFFYRAQPADRRNH